MFQIHGWIPWIKKPTKGLGCPQILYPCSTEEQETQPLPPTPHPIPRDDCAGAGRIEQDRWQFLPSCILEVKNHTKWDLDIFREFAKRKIQLSSFKSWKMMPWKCCTQYASKFRKLSSGHRTGKGQFSFQSQRKAMPKNAQTTALALISHTSKVMLKILQSQASTIHEL